MDNQNLEEFQDSTSNVTNTEAVSNSTQQGHITAITKLVRSIERADHQVHLHWLLYTVEKSVATFPY